MHDLQVVAGVSFRVRLRVRKKVAWVSCRSFRVRDREEVAGKKVE